MRPEGEKRGEDAARAGGGGVFSDDLLQARKMEAIARLAGGIAHDFNNLLTAILSYAEMLEDQIPADDARRGLATEIGKAGRRAASLTQQLLAFGRRQVLKPRILDLGTAVATVEGLLRRTVGDRVALVLVPARDLGRVKADPNQLEQVLLHLASNARDAMPQGGTLRIEMRNAELDATYAREHPGVKAGPYVLLTVADTGCGMDAEVLSHIFEPFFTTKAVGKGTGLGLATVYGIVKQSGGHVSVRSEPGRGTTFDVHFPRVEDVATPVEPVPLRRSGPRGTETVLLVEDETVVRRLTRRILDTAGYTVLEARDPEEALALASARGRSIHIVLTDVVMPGMNGRQLYERLVAAIPGLRVLYMSGYTENAVVHDGVLDKGTPFLSKPFTPEALCRALRAVLDARGPTA